MSEKPYKGQISNWRRRRFQVTPEYAHTLGYCIAGCPSGHPNFTNWIITSAVVKHEGDQIETMNSRYTLVDEELPATSTKISKSDL